MKTSYLNFEIYSKLNEAAINKDESAQHRQKVFVKAIIPAMTAVVVLKEVESSFSNVTSVNQGTE